MANKPIMSVSIDPDILKWIDEQIEEKRFASRSHAVEYCLHKMMVRESGKNPIEAVAAL